MRFNGSFVRYKMIFVSVPKPQEIYKMYVSYCLFVGTLPSNHNAPFLPEVDR